MARGGAQGIGDSNGCVLILQRENDPNGTSVKTVEEMLRPFDETWIRQRTPDRTIKFNPEDFKKYLGPGPNDKGSGGQYQ
jgi:hypothetical protein